MGGKNQQDYGDIATAQGEENRDVVRDQLYANRPDQVTPWGTTSWKAVPWTDAEGNEVTRWQQTQSLSEPLQQILNNQFQLQDGRSQIAAHLLGRTANEFGSPMDYSGMTPLGQVPLQQYTLPEPVQRQLDYSGAPQMQDPTQLRGRAEDARFNKSASRLQPAFESARQAAEVQMRNQGLGPEDAAWKSRMQGIGQQETDAYGQAQYDAVTGGMQEANQLYNQNMGQRSMYTNEADRMGQFYNQAGGQAWQQAMGSNAQNYGQNMQTSNYANQIRQQQMAEQMQKRGFSLNEINALMSGQQVQAPQMPSFAQASAASPAPIYQAGVDQGNMAQAMNPMAGLMGMAGQIGGAYAGKG